MPLLLIRLLLPIIQQTDFKVTGELVSEEAGLFVKKGNKDLLDKLTKALNEVKGTEEWNELINKYFGG